MDLRTGRSGRREGPAPLRAVPGVAPDALPDAPNGIGELEGGVREDVALLRDAETLVTARRRLDGLLLQLAVNPFDPVAYRGLGSYLVGPGVLALAAYERVRASTVRGT
jgi:hypothetical protein